MKERIISYMREFGSITTYNAFIDLGCTRLSEYIRQLREEDLCDGVHIMAIGAEENVPAILDEAGL